MNPFPAFRFILFLAALSLLACPTLASHAAPAPLGPLLSLGRVVDATTGKPVPGALVTIDGREALPADVNGFFPLRPAVKRIAARAYGYSRDELIVSAPLSTVELRLRPVRPKALYLTAYGINSKSLRDGALKLIDATELNALVIDMKGDRGLIPYKSSLPLAAAIGAQKLILVKDIKELVQRLKDRGIYTIARIVVFKDDLLGTARPDLAIKTGAGKVWRDREGLIWVDPSRKEVWDYAIAVACEAAGHGFDEIQFDYVRFPDQKGLAFGVPNTEENRVAAISGFLEEARKRLAPYNVFVAADIFGYVAWNINDTHIGQRIDRLGPFVDYLSLMLYPSGFQYGIPGYRNPVANSYKIVYLTMKRAQERARLPAVRFRPWLQAFRDYAFDRRYFRGHEIREQIRAAEDFGADGWMLWNPRNIYGADGLKK